MISSDALASPALTAWFVFGPDGKPHLFATRATRDEAMQACFGSQFNDRHGRRRDHWQDSLDAGWTCREVSLAPPSAGAAGAPLAEVERALAQFEMASNLAAMGDETAFEIRDRQRTAVLDAVRALLTPAGEIPALIDKAMTAQGAFSGWAGSIGSKVGDASWRRLEAERDVTRATLLAAVVSLGRSGAPGAGGVAEDLSQAARDVLAERRRQVEVEGWTPDHDNKHDDGQLALAAVCYALPEYQQGIKTAAHPTMPQPTLIERLWPWDPDWWRPNGERRDLVKAGALILAELERLDRADLRSRIAAEGRAAGTAPARDEGVGT